MARFWVFVTLAATLMLTGLAAMTEDRGPPPAAAVLPPANADALVPPDPVDRGSRKSYERRNQRTQDRENSQLQTGSILMAHLAAPGKPDAGAATLPVLVPVPIALTREGSLARAATASVAVTRSGARQPVPKRSKGDISAAGNAILVSAVSGPEPGYSALAMDVARRVDNPELRLPEPKSPRQSGVQPYARRRHAGPRHADHQAGPRRPPLRRYVRQESLWPRTQRDGS